VVVVNDLILVNAITAMEVDTSRVTVQNQGRVLTEAAWNVTSAMRWVTSLVTAQTPVAVAVPAGLVMVMDTAAVEEVVAAVVVLVDRTCAATTATRWDTSLATVPPLHHRRCRDRWLRGDKSGWLILLVEREPSGNAQCSPRQPESHPPSCSP